ncbi:MAG: hypothetical protein JHD02_00375 [Thermoleophilaceae bacterium]|nr:hypothetical protein [Thermoleophilaceae bacterium]
MTRQITRTFMVGALAVSVLATAGCGGATAATYAPTVGIGDNSHQMFLDADHRSLKTKIARKIIPYDFRHHKHERDSLDAWMKAARAAGVEPHIAFNHSVNYPTKLPSVSNFQASLRHLKKNYPELRVFTPWNEANHRSQPTKTNPARAAQYYNAARRICTDCKIVAADVLDQANMLPWIATFRKTAYKPKIWGLHSYVDAQRNRAYRNSNTRKFVNAVPGEVWLTEVGGIVALGRVYSYSESRAAQGVKATLKLSLGDRRIKRVYLYSWFGTSQPHRKPYLWDSGLASWDGKPRPGFFALRSWLKSHPSALVKK